jgi:hypothetical protein
LERELVGVNLAISEDQAEADEQEDRKVILLEESDDDEDFVG